MIGIDEPIKDPEILYKYRAWDEFGRKALTEFQLYLSSPMDFNDPFDCKIPTNFLLMNEEEKDQYIDQLIESYKDQILIEGGDIIESKSRLKSKLNISNIRNVQKENETISFEEYNKRLGVLSLSLNWDNILMWSHYGDRHCGFCIGFYERQLKNSDLFGTGRLVEYPKKNEYPLIHPLEDLKQEIKTILKNTHTKAWDWHYEKEFRWTKFFYPEIPTIRDRQIIIKPDFISDVTIGLRTPKDIKARIIQICKNYGIKVYQAKQVEFKFQLDRDPI